MDYVDLTQSFFKEHPSVVFSRNMRVPIGFWSDMWRRYGDLAYKPADLKDWFELKVGREISEKTIRRYIVRQELYNQARKMVKKGEKTIHIQHFTKHHDYLQPFLIELILK